jgi:hypothetical protein
MRLCALVCPISRLPEFSPACQARTHRRSRTPQLRAGNTAHSRLVLTRSCSHPLTTLLTVGAQRTRTRPGRQLRQDPLLGFGFNKRIAPRSCFSPCS